MTERATDDEDDDRTPLTDEEILAVAPEFAYRASLLVRLHRADLIREPRTVEEAELVAEVRQLFEP